MRSRVYNIGKIVFWIGLLFLIYMFAILTNETGKNYQLRAKSEELETQISQLESQIEELGYKVTYYKTSSYQDRLAREKLGMQAPGESVVIIKKDSNTTQEVRAETVDLRTADEIEASKSNWQQWMDFLFGS